MSDETVIRCCAPTLAAIKTGSLFNSPFESRKEMTASLRAINKNLLPKGVCTMPLRYENGKALIYLYRPSMLEEDLRNPVAAELLKDSEPEYAEKYRLLAEDCGASAPAHFLTAQI